MSPYYNHPGAHHHKLYEFVAHGSAVTCLSLGQKSGRVMVTGGDDHKVNLWAIGKPNVIMSLNGHRTPIECAKFNHNEDVVGAGSQAGVIKLWDLEQAKLIQTLLGHKTNVRCLDFHPYGQFLASGSFDTSIKLWDYRKKGCIFTYKAHTKDVHCLKLSPDGRWLASGGNEGSVMLYDIVAGKMLAELKGHSSSITDVMFHPNEFLLASSSSDGTAKFWDLESFEPVSTTNYQSDVGPIRKIAFHPEGKALITGAKDILKVYSWEPTRLYDSLCVKWGRLNDMAVLDDQLIAGTYNMTNVSVFIVDITSLQPFNYINSMKNSLYSRGSALRQSSRRNFTFNESNKTCKQLESLDSNRTDELETNGGGSSEGDADSLAEIYNACDYKEIFQSRRELNRTPPLPDDDDEEEDDGDDNDSCKSDAKHLRSLPETTMNMLMVNGNYPPSSAMMPAVTPTGNGNFFAAPTSGGGQMTASMRHLSESMSNIYLANSNHQPSSHHAHYQHSHHQNHAAKATPTFPLISPVSKSGGSAATTPSHHHASAAAKHQHFPLVANPGNNTPTSKVASTTSNSSSAPTTKITSVVRPVMNEASHSNLKSPSTTSATTTGFKPTHIAKPNSLDLKSSSSTAARSTKMVDHSPSSASATNNFSMIPDARDQSAGLDFNDFLPKHIQKFGYDAAPPLSDVEALTVIAQGHKAARTGLEYRRRQVQIVLAMWATKDSRTALEYAISLEERAVIVDILNVMILKSTLWNLDICLVLLPCIQELLECKYESYMSLGCSSLSLILKTFSATIKSNISGPPGIGVDISREERYNKCMKVYNHLLTARAFVLKRQTLQGKIGRSFRELSILFTSLE